MTTRQGTSCHYQKSYLDFSFWYWNSICQFHQYIYKYWDGNAVYCCQHNKSKEYFLCVLNPRKVKSVLVRQVSVCPIRNALSFSQNLSTLEGIPLKPISMSLLWWSVLSSPFSLSRTARSMTLSVRRSVLLALLLTKNKGLLSNKGWSQIFTHQHLNHLDYNLPWSEFSIVNCGMQVAQVLVKSSQEQLCISLITSIPNSKRAKNKK